MATLRAAHADEAERQQVAAAEWQARLAREREEWESRAATQVEAWALAEAEWREQLQRAEQAAEAAANELVEKESELETVIETATLQKEELRREKNELETRLAHINQLALELKNAHLSSQQQQQRTSALTFTSPTRSSTLLLSPNMRGALTSPAANCGGASSSVSVEEALRQPLLDYRAAQRELQQLRQDNLLLSSELERHWLLVSEWEARAARVCGERDQLVDEYAAARNQLSVQAAQLEQVQSELAALSGHANHAQKIQLHMKIKGENERLRLERERAEKENRLLRRKLHTLTVVTQQLQALQHTATATAHTAQVAHTLPSSEVTHLLHAAAASATASSSSSSLENNENNPLADDNAQTSANQNAGEDDLQQLLHVITNLQQQQQQQQHKKQSQAAKQPTLRDVTNAQSAEADKDKEKEKEKEKGIQNYIHILRDYIQYHSHLEKQYQHLVSDLTMQDQLKSKIKLIMTQYHQQQPHAADQNQSVGVDMHMLKQRKEKLLEFAATAQV